MEVTYWHRLAQLYLNKEIQLYEIVRLMMFASVVGMLDDKEPRVMTFGMNILDNSGTNDALVLGILLNNPPDKTISYTDIGRLLVLHNQTIGSAVNRLIKRGLVTKQDAGREGAYYTVHTEKLQYIPIWIREFTKALIELHHNPALKAEVMKQVEKIGFLRGLQVLEKEIREKFFRRNKDGKKGEGK